MGGGARLLHALYASSYLSFLKPNSLLVSTYTTLFSKETNGYTLPNSGAKMLIDKMCLLIPIYSTLIINTGTIYLSQDHTQSKVVTCSRVMFAV